MDTLGESKYLLIAEEDDFYIVAKSIGVSFEGEEGLVQELRKSLGEIYGVHRLDKETSGLMIFAKNKNAQSDLSKLFSEKQVHKLYLALSLGRPKKKQGKIKGDLEKGRGGSYYLKPSLDNPSETSFISQFFEEQKLRVFLLRPKTGKTHQLRVHLRSLAASILGDIRYGTDTADRMYLSAIELSFSYKGKEYSFYHYPK